MEQQTEITQLLDMMVQPGFCVKENIITERNAAAGGLLLSQGEDVRGLIVQGGEEYARFDGGCLYLRLKLGERSWGAAVVRTEDRDVFLLDPEPVTPELQAYALAAQHLRSPMSNALIAADQLTEAEDPEVRKQAGQVSRGLHQLLRIVNNMSDALLYATMTQQEIRNLSAVFDEIFEKAQAQLAQADRVLIYHGLSEGVYCLADAVQLERAVLNILANAARFSPAGGTITARLTRSADSLRLSISDTGPGIAQEVMQQIFRRHLRQPCIEDGRYGLGLGLVLARTAALNHGGTLLIDQPQGSARITMTLSLRTRDSAILRSPIIQMDFYGGRDHGLIELSQVLPASMYEGQTK